MTAPLPLIAGNWKMHKPPAEAADLARAIAAGSADLDAIDVVICPPFISIEAARAAVAGSPIRLGAQDGFPRPSGAFTGAVSMAMLSGIVDFVIVGHSERRQFFGENDELVARKVAAALEAGLRPILCVGETAEQRAEGVTDEVLVAQTWNALVGQDDVARVAVAYEPVWAIGTGNHAQPADAAAAAVCIRRVIADICDEATARQVRVLYGGSVTPENARGFLREPGIDGALVGGASLVAASFLAIVRSARP